MTETVEKHALLAVISEPLRERLKNTLRDQLRDALYCTRVWDAWGVGTMSEDDFECLADSDEYVDQLADAVLLTLLNKE
jgi:hypothetical protein